MPEILPKDRVIVNRAMEPSILGIHGVPDLWSNPSLPLLKFSHQIVCELTRNSHN